MVPKRKLAVFVDGANIYAASKALNFRIDFAKMRQWFNNKGDVLRVYFYTALVEDTGGAIPLQGMVDWLSYNGYSVVTKVAKRYADINGERERIKGNMDVEFTLDVYKLAMTGKVDEIYLLTGDGDFRMLVQEIQNMGIKVIVMSTIACHPPMVSDVLRKQADLFLDLKDVQEAWYSEK